MRNYQFIFVVLTVLFLSNTAFPENSFSKEQRDAVEEVLRNQNRRDWSKTPWQEHAEDLEYLGDDVITLLSDFLENYELGHEASQTMLVIDATRAAPLIFASMPKSDRNVQYHTFKYFRRMIQNHQPFRFSSEMHDAAVRCLEADTNADAAEEALLAIGLTGSKKDFPLLEKYYGNKHPTEVWATKLRNASEAALARLGDKSHLDNITKELRKRVPAKLSLEEAVFINNAIEKAAFSGDKRFIPLLCAHLDTPHFRESDYGVSPAWAAAQGLDQIVNGTSPDSVRTSIEYWKERCPKLCSGAEK